MFSSWPWAQASGTCPLGAVSLPPAADANESDSASGHTSATPGTALARSTAGWAAAGGGYSRLLHNAPGMAAWALLFRNRRGPGETGRAESRAVSHCRSSRATRSWQAASKGYRVGQHQKGGALELDAGSTRTRGLGRELGSSHRPWAPRLSWFGSGGGGGSQGGVAASGLGRNQPC